MSADREYVFEVYAKWEMKLLSRKALVATNRDGFVLIDGVDRAEVARVISEGLNIADLSTMTYEVLSEWVAGVLG